MERSVSGFGMEGSEEVREYRIHVSSKYLDLTRKKLELTRLPHELDLDDTENETERAERAWEMGAPKGVVEPLVDYWSETYSFRMRETYFNATYPQFRSSFSVPGQSKEVRLHFVHLRSPRPEAIPLLLVPSFPLTNLSVPISLLKSLTEPEDVEEQAFNVVVPSIPGLGFSDALSSNADVLLKTAALFDSLMQRLGYHYYLCSATGSGKTSPAGVDYHLPRLIAGRSRESCLGVHLIDPPVEAPAPWSLDNMKFRVAEFFHANIFGYRSADFVSLKRSKAVKKAEKRSIAGMLGLREPITFAYGLCDSPVGILSLVASGLRKRSHVLSESLGMEKVVDLVTLAWLPGPEAGLRFWCAANDEVESTTEERRGRVGVTVFNNDTGELDEESYTPLAWTSARHDVVWSERVDGRPGLVLLEREDVLIKGIRSFAKIVGDADGRLKVQPLQAVIVPRIDVTVDDIISLSEITEDDEGESLQVEAASPDTVIAASLA